jgi:hypothetical protein
MRASDAAAQTLTVILRERIMPMRSMKTPEAPPIPIKLVVTSNIMSARLTIRKDEAAKRKLADTDGTVRRARQVAERNRLI